MTPRRSTERAADREGIGQSGYTAGRGADPALERDTEVRAPSRRAGSEDGSPDELPTTDDRFTGRG